MVRLERAGQLFGRGPIPSPYMLFVHDVAPEWRDQIPPWSTSMGRPHPDR
jgi:carbamoyltransferase